MFITTVWYNESMVKNKRILAIILAWTVLIAPVTSFADTTPPAVAATPATTDEKAQLQQQLDAIENQIAAFQQQLSGIQSQKSTLANKLKQLQIQQASLSLQIQQTNLNVQATETQIETTSQQIDDNNQKIAEMKIQLANAIVQINERDNLSTAEILLSTNGLAGFSAELNDYAQLDKSLVSLAANIRQNTADLQQQAQQLADQKDQQSNLISIASLQSSQLSGSISSQADLLKQTKGKEADYQIVLNDTQKQAAQIRGRLYQLTGGGPQTHVTFGQALAIAQSVSSLTGVRAAFLLAILTQESNLGQNVGTCNRAGDPPSKSWKTVMKPDRDQQPFLQITSELGLDPDTTPVSCPMHDAKGNQVGWGGAMGPAQFIPSTWIGYKDKVAALTGKPANPWDINDAFTAAAIKLKADGAGTQSGEWAAAMRYFSGSTNVRYRFYGDSVVAQAQEYQNDIDNLNQS